MKILIVGLSPTNQQINRLREEAQKLGHHLDSCYAGDLIIKSKSKKFQVEIKNLNINDYQLIYLWTTGRRRWHWYTACQYLTETTKPIIIDQKILDPHYQLFFSSALDYLKQTKLNLPFPQTTLITHINSVKKIINDFHFPLILKKSPSSKGQGVFKVNSIQQIKDIIRNNEDNKTSAWIIREYIENEGDIRIFTIGYKAIGAMKRTAKKGDFRNNISQGGSGAEFDLTQNPQIKNIAEKAAYMTRTEIAGVDIIIDKNTGKPYILEINHGPQFKGLEQYTKINAAAKITKYFDSLLQTR